MKELEYILRNHAARYPAMEPTDAVKLIYQSEFGGGHLIRDREKAYRYLQQEYETIEKNRQHPRYEAIGNGICRVHLAALDAEELEGLFAAFVASAQEHKGAVADFEKKLQLLRKLSADNVFSFDEAQLEQYLEDYKVAGYPAVSHSEIYRNLYKPAYRIVYRAFLPENKKDAIK